MKRKVTMHISRCAYRSTGVTIKDAGRGKPYPKSLCGLKPKGRGVDVYCLHLNPGGWGDITTYCGLSECVASVPVKFYIRVYHGQSIVTNMCRACINHPHVTLKLLELSGF